MDLGLRGLKAIVCASSRGLGKASALALAREGVCVVINGRNDEALAAARDEIAAATGARVTSVRADVATREGQDISDADLTHALTDSGYDVKGITRTRRSIDAIRAELKAKAK